jgi:undecaprenyl-diphosphatase
MPLARSGKAEQAVPVVHALALGLLQGPTELLPISSSGHLALVPWLLGWEWDDIDEDLRKGFEVTLHGGAAAALVISSPDELIPRTVEQCALLGLSVAPAALLGYVLERPIERWLGTPPTVAVGLLVGALGLQLSDRGPRERTREDAGPRDALWLGLAQAWALFPGVSRGGATISAARLRRFKRADAHLLSREVALPVIAGAAVLKGVRLRARRLRPTARAPFIVGALASFASTLAARPLLRLAEEDRPLTPNAAYRMALAAAVFARLRSTPGAPPRGLPARAPFRTSRR